ncbi:MAG: hypothetical protein OQJ98_02885 [Candidatus Pacebacteria bacterium]|nr:hypothetical protein [Candidatus Paceibacterota bacterium]
MRKSQQSASWSSNVKNRSQKEKITLNPSPAGARKEAVVKLTRQTRGANRSGEYDEAMRLFMGRKDVEFRVRLTAAMHERMIQSLVRYDCRTQSQLARELIAFGLASSGSSSPKDMKKLFRLHWQLESCLAQAGIIQPSAFSSIDLKEDDLFDETLKMLKLLIEALQNQKLFACRDA